MQHENQELRRRVAQLERKLRTLAASPTHTEENTAGGSQHPDATPSESDSDRGFCDRAQLLHTYVEAANDMVYAVDLKGRLTFVNPYGERLLGCGVDEWRGCSYLDFVAPSSQTPTALAFENLLKTGELKDFEFQLQPRYGEPIDLEVNGRLLYRDGVVVGGLGIARDIRDRKQFERQLQMFLKAVESAYDSATIVNANGQIVYANPATAQMFGYDINGLCGRDATLFFPPGAPVSIQDLIGRAFDGDRAPSSNVPSSRGWSGEVICQRSNGDRFPALISVSPIPNESETPLTVSIICRDITQQKADRAELAAKNLELERASRLKSAFLANMSHELRTPLTSILGFSNLLLQRLYGELTEKQELYVERIHESGEHLLRLIGDILDLSKVEAGKIELELGAVDVKKLCREAVAFVSEQARSRHLEIRTQIPEEIEPITADELRLRQMLLNLLSNAVKFSQPQTSVGIEVQQHQDWLYLNVWDEGIGIPESQQALLFQPFQQLDNSLSRQHEGTGLGLALTRKLAELHGGTVTCRSQPGVGSCFTIILPRQLALPKDPHTTPAWTDVTNSPVSPPPVSQVLIVEDREDNALLLKDILEFWGYAVHCVGDGQTALDWLQSNRPDAILLDVHLPGIDGLEVTRRLKADPLRREIPLIATTALAMVGDRDRCLQAGFDEYLSKPVSCDRLAKVLADYLPHPPIMQASSGESA